MHTLRSLSGIHRSQNDGIPDRFASLPVTDFQSSANSETNAKMALVLLNVRRPIIRHPSRPQLGVNLHNSRSVPSPNAHVHFLAHLHHHCVPRKPLTFISPTRLTRLAIAKALLEEVVHVSLCAAFDAPRRGAWCVRCTTYVLRARLRPRRSTRSNAGNNLSAGNTPRHCCGIL